MKTFIALAVATFGGAVALRYLPAELRGRLTSGVKHRMSEHMEHMMAEFPEGSPPKLVMSILPKLQAQNDQIIALLQEQNELLRMPEHSSTSEGAA
jgi:hypothetical protein